MTRFVGGNLNVSPAMNKDNPGWSCFGRNELPVFSVCLFFSSIYLTFFFVEKIIFVNISVTIVRVMCIKS